MKIIKILGIAVIVGFLLFIFIDNSEYDTKIKNQGQNGVFDYEKILFENSWVWDATFYIDNQSVRPANKNDFVLSLTENSFSLKTDCNNAGGYLAIDKSEIYFSDIFITEMYCEGSKDVEFTKMLSGVSDFYFKEGNLYLSSKENDYFIVLEPLN